MNDGEKGASVVGAAVVERVVVDPVYLSEGRPRVAFYVRGISPHGPVEFVGTSTIPGDMAGAIDNALEMFLSYLRAKERERAIG